MPDVAYCCVLQEIGALPGSIRTCQHRVRKHHADPAAGSNNLQRTTEEEKVAIRLAALLRRLIAAKIGILSREVRRISDEEVNTWSPGKCKAIGLVNLQCTF